LLDYYLPSFLTQFAISKMLVAAKLPIKHDEEGHFDVHRGDRKKNHYFNFG